MMDNMGEMDDFKTHLREEARKRNTAFYKLSSEEKFEVLRNEIDTLQRIVRRLVTEKNNVERELKVISVNNFLCKDGYNEEGREALLLTYEDGTVIVKCPDDCSWCNYNF
jgi:hypothetical protein